jgi:hypothetical protein
MRQSIFIALVLSGVAISVFLYRPDAKFQVKSIAYKIIDRLGSVGNKNEDKNLYEMALKTPASDVYNKNSRPINKNKDFIDSLISRGALSIDKQMFKIYVDTTFWNEMDYPAKNNFCMAVNEIYTGYFMVDKDSGKTLANTNRLGEISIMQ